MRETIFKPLSPNEHFRKYGCVCSSGLMADSKDKISVVAATRVLNMVKKHCCQVSHFLGVTTRISAS